MSGVRPSRVAPVADPEQDVDVLRHHLGDAQQTVLKQQDEISALRKSLASSRAMTSPARSALQSSSSSALNVDWRARCVDAEKECGELRLQLAAANERIAKLCDLRKEFENAIESPHKKQRVSPSPPSALCERCSKMSESGLMKQLVADAKARSEQRVEQLSKLCNSLSDQVRDMTTQCDARVQAAADDVAAAKREAQTLRAQSVELKQRAELAEKWLEDAKAQHAALQSVPNASAEVERITEQRDTLAAEVQELRSALKAEREGRSQASAHPNDAKQRELILHLEHKLQDAEKRCEQMEKGRVSVEAANATIHALQQELEEWEQAAAECDGVKGAHNLQSWVRTMRQEVVGKVQQVSESRASVEDLQARLKAAQAKANQLGQQVKLKDRMCEDLNSQLNTAEGLLRAKEDECQRLEKALVPHANEKNAAEGAEEQEVKLRSQIDVLEAQCRSLQMSVKSKCEALDQESSRANDLMLQRDELERRLDESKREADRLAKEAELLETQVARLESAIDSGTHYNPKTTKILHLSMNPESAALARDNEDRHVLQQKVDELTEENKGLLLRIGSLESGVVGDIKATPKAKEAVCAEIEKARQETVAVRESLEAEKKKNQRLVEVFKTKIHEFRESCYQLTGFRIDMIGNQYKLTSMYAERSGDCFLFQVDSNGVLQLLETELCKQWESEIHTFLATCKSIPAFLSHFTMQMFQRQTFVP